MDSIMQYTDGLWTAGATAWFAITFLAGVWLAGRYRKATLLPSILAALVVGYARFGLELPPLNVLAIASMGVLHIASGCWLGLLFKGRKSQSQPSR